MGFQGERERLHERGKFGQRNIGIENREKRKRERNREGEDKDKEDERHREKSGKHNMRKKQ